MNYDDTDCSIACYKGQICGAGGTCYCKNQVRPTLCRVSVSRSERSSHKLPWRVDDPSQDPYAALPIATYNGVCMGTALQSWSITGSCHDRTYAFSLRRNIDRALCVHLCGQA